MIQILVVLGFFAAAEAGYIGAGGGGTGGFYGGGGGGVGGSYVNVVPVQIGAGGGYGRQPVYPSIPTPYAFNYAAPALGGFSARQESGDGYGRVRGSYKLSGADGRQRKVQYTAGPEGFRAHIYTNEPGTKSENPADVVVQSSAPVAPPYYPPRRHHGYGASAGGGGGGHQKYIIVPGSGPWQ
ncbi:heterogeneous nuclear ribonucleoprotein A3 homolog 2-like [Limulus polyphemus]|uniref:Heterogeneous nuclear ribonucleoprotein A3 homolog 2-like n=1 Tax=Limulus polyphemus TaxID=6850 RepID=A0ABM1BB63_LIMPO|nr:heterogeneous nuclear ribonucleoprotein A3 homolog 2-like [Limulus polyphemus]